MVKALLATCCMVFLVSCRCQRTGDTEKEALGEPVSSEKIKDFLGDKNFDILSSADSGLVLDITKKRIEGTADEYSNKLVLRDTLTTEQAEALRALLLDDTSYDWSEKEHTTVFDPELQILLRNGTKRITLRIESESRRLAFNTLEGQKLVALSNRLVDHFERLR